MNSGPGSVVVNRGSTSVSVASVTTVASDEPVPSALKTASPDRPAPLIAPTSSDRPTMPLTLIITAAKTVSRASAEVSFSPLTISVTISATSMTVTATASNERAERLADPVGHDLCVMHGGQHRADEDREDHAGQDGVRVLSPGEDQEDHRGDRREGGPRPPGRPGVPHLRRHAATLGG